MVVVSTVFGQAQDTRTSFPYPPGMGSGGGSWLSSKTTIWPGSPSDSTKVKLSYTGAFWLPSATSAASALRVGTATVYDIGSGVLYSASGYWGQVGYKIGASGTAGLFLGPDGAAIHFASQSPTAYVILKNGKMRFGASATNQYPGMSDVQSSGVRTDTIIAPLRVVDTTGWTVLDSTAYVIIEEVAHKTPPYGLNFKTGTTEILVNKGKYNSEAVVMDFGVVADSANGYQIEMIELYLKSAGYQYSVPNGITDGNGYTTERRVVIHWGQSEQRWIVNNVFGAGALPSTSTVNFSVWNPNKCEIRIPVTVNYQNRIMCRLVVHWTASAGATSARPITIVENLTSP